jgi:hypothetical protein
MTNDVLQLVYSAIDELNRQLPRAKHVARSESTPLTGSDGALDSLNFLNLIVLVEDRANAAHGTSIALASLLMEAQVPVPRTVSELAALVSAQLNGAGHA